MSDTRETENRADAATGSDYVLEALGEEGVSTLFGVIGEGNAHLLDRTHDHPVAFEQARHEQAAVTMADGYARTEGEVAACTVTHGPGLTNAATGIAAADRDNVPLVVLIGDTDTVGRETSLQYLDHATLSSPISAYQTRAETPAGLPEAIHRAFDRARTESGPAIVELPGDVQEGEAPDAEYTPATNQQHRIRPDPERLAEAVAALEDADDPFVLAGGGAARSGAGEALADLASTIGAPIATTYFAKGILPESHPLVSGISGTFLSPANDRLARDADVVLAVGTTLSGKITRYGELYDAATIVQIDVDRGVFGEHVPVDVEVVGDATATVERLTERVSADHDRVERVERAIREAPNPTEEALAEARTKEGNADDGTVDPRAVVAALSNRLPDETVVAVDSGNNTGFPAVFHEVSKDGRMLVNGNFGTMGYSLPVALGAQVADRDRPVVAYVGDGSLLQVVQEVETAVRLELPVVIVILNDSSYGIIRHRQRLELGRETASAYDSPAFEQVARGLGAEATTVRSIEELDALDAIEDHLAGEATTPFVIDVRTDPEVSRPGFPPY